MLVNTLNAGEALGTATAVQRVKVRTRTVSLSTCCATLPFPRILDITAPVHILCPEPDHNVAASV